MTKASFDKKNDYQQKKKISSLLTAAIFTEKSIKYVHEKFLKRNMMNFFENRFLKVVD